MFQTLGMLFFRLFLLSVLFLPVLSEPVLKSVAVHNVWFELKSEPGSEQLLLIKARSTVNGLANQAISTETTIRRTDGTPLALTKALPAGWKQTENGLEYGWSGENEHSQSEWKLGTAIPVDTISSVPSVPIRLLVRYTVRCGDMSSYLDSEISFPFFSSQSTRELMFDGITLTPIVSEYQQPDVAGMDVISPEITVQEHAVEFVFLFSAKGMKGENAYVGVVFRSPDGIPVQPSNSCPESNHGQKGRVQFQKGDQVLYDHASWDNFRLRVPVQWLEVDTSTDQSLIATCYMSAGGLWALHDREIIIRGIGVELPKPAGYKASGKVFPGLLESVASGIMTPTEALFRSVEAGEGDAVEYFLVGGGDVRARNLAGQVPLHVAAAAGQDAVAKVLIQADLDRAGQESQPGFFVSADSYLRDICPTLHMQDAGGNTPLHLAAASGNSAMAKLMIDNGADSSVKNSQEQTAAEMARKHGFPQVADMTSGVHKPFQPKDPAGSDPASDITRYTSPLREILAEIQGIQGRFDQLRSAGRPSIQEVREQGLALHRVGDRYIRLFRDGGEDSITRFGTIEEVEIVTAIRTAHEQAALTFKDLARVELPAAVSPSSNRNSNQSILQQVGKSLIEERVIRYIKREGLADMLSDDGQSILGGEVRKSLELDLKGFMDKKSVELVGMPLGGFKSMQAAFRLQARRQISAQISELVLNFTGNRIVILLLQRTVLKWVEGELWPFLREAFRPKAKLGRRVDISTNTMMAMCDELNALAGGRNPRTVPLVDVSDAIDRAHGKINAARYLRKDLERSGSQDLKDTLAAAENILNRTIKRVSFQFLLLDQDRWQEFSDNFQYTAGIHEDVGKLLGLMTVSQCELKVAPEQEALASGNYSRRGSSLLPVFDLRVTGIPVGTPAGIKRMAVRINSRNYLLFTVYRAGEDSVRFEGSLPLFPGRSEVVFSSPDIPGVPETSRMYSFPPPQADDITKWMEGELQYLPGMEQDMLQASDYYRSRRTWELGQKLLSISEYGCRLGKFSGSAQLIPKALEYIEQSRRGPESSKDLAGAYSQQAWIALSADNRRDYLTYKDAELKARLQYLQYLKSENLFRPLDLGPAYETCFEMADMLLALGLDSGTARPYVNRGMELLAQRNPGQGSAAFDNNMKQDYPNIGAVFFGN